MIPSLVSPMVACSAIVSALTQFPQAHGAVYDLRTNPTIVVPTAFGNAIFTTNFTTSVPLPDTPFLAIGANGTERGYNTYKGVFDTQWESEGNHEIRMSDLNPTRTTYFGKDYYVFAITTYENSGSASTISLDSLKIYASSTNGKTTANVDSLGTKLFELNASDFIFYDDNFRAEGQKDFAFFIPASVFNGVSADKYIYMYQSWGANDTGGSDGASGGHWEKTFLGVGISLVPEPSALIPLASVLGFALSSRRLIRRRS